MKKDKLEDFILQNKEYLEDDFPDRGHLERFERKLQQYHGKISLNKRILLIKIAASVTIFITIAGLGLKIYLHNFYPDRIVNKTVVNVEFQETFEYYAGQINIGLEKLNSIHFSDSNQRDSISKELSLMDLNCKQLEFELKTNPNDERIMRAIIESYQVKLDAVNLILQSSAISINNSKNVNHENKI